MSKKIKTLIFIISFFLQNIIQCVRFTRLETRTLSHITLRGMRPGEEEEVGFLYSQMTGNKLPRYRKYLFRILGRKTVVIATISKDGRESLVGVNFYYFNARDIRENTVHEAFLGVVPNLQGRGIATAMRGLAKDFFYENGLAGISTRISVSNLASLRSAEKVGFRVLEEYADRMTGKRRYYMVCKLAKK